jgi:type III secretion protein D
VAEYGIMNAIAKLKVVSGRHAGAVQELGSDQVAIGNSMTADIVLTDPSVAPVHAKVTCGDFRFVLEAVSSSISIADKKLAPGEVLKCTYPKPFTLGDVEVECISSRKGVLLALTNRNVFAALFGIFFAVAVAGILLPSRNPDPSSGRARRQAPQPIVQSNEANAAAKQEVIQAAANALLQQLQSVGLQTIEISAEDGVVRARGSIVQSSQDAWRAIQVWFDGAYGQRVMLQPEVVVKGIKTQAAPIAIQAVWAGKRPYLIDDHGDKYFEGSFLKDGWVIEKIEDRKVILKRKDEIISLEL